ncbi:peptidoglycan DD-metalloendopeptidase family protein [Leptolyngbya sp. 'hensonii']|uniref:peptidoglycan DD-metalloendopeptidase family protein n=1 Tax=Leptolyngbya sp. 'hensonii' TaxID=1922337 RepID=UPI0009F85BF5|nr:peptidoglycan DD-metalloendopeptidase family protein [Leptolyngbya sp. 'hensonii']
MTLANPSQPSARDLQQQQQQVNQIRSTVQQEQRRLQNLQQQAESNWGLLQQNIQMTQTQLQDYTYQLELAKKYLKELQQDLKLAVQGYRKRQAATVARLQFLQRQQRRHGLALLLQSRNLNEFLDRRHQLRLVYRTDQQQLLELKTEADRINSRRLEIERQKNQIALLTQKLLAQKSGFEAQAKSQQSLVQRLRSDRAALEAAEQQLAQDSASLTTLIRKRVSEERAQGQTSQPNIIAYGTGGRMGYPVDGPISSYFGWRVHPILGYEKFHAGLDFAVDYGTTVHAAGGGIVILADWYGGYGNAVIIDHGNGITTLYGHNSELYVSEGQTVQRGQAISAVGSTGFSTGPHLHFEVRQDGEPVDPMAFF